MRTETASNFTVIRVSDSNPPLYFDVQDLSGTIYRTAIVPPPKCWHCPFCGSDGFNKISLKEHLNGKDFCLEYYNTEPCGFRPSS